MTVTDNSNLSLKVAFRIRHLPEGKVSVLDCFAGEGLIWQKVAASTRVPVEVDSIEMAKGKGAPSFVGDNRKLLPVLDLRPYNVIDLDAYGTPYRQVVAILGNATRVPGTVIFYTLNRCVRADSALLVRHDFTPQMVMKAPILCSSWGYRAWCQALAVAGVRELWEIHVPRSGGYHRYGMFRLPEVLA